MEKRPYNKLTRMQSHKMYQVLMEHGEKWVKRGRSLAEIATLLTGPLEGKEPSESSVRMGMKDLGIELPRVYVRAVNKRRSQQIVNLAHIVLRLASDLQKPLERDEMANLQEIINGGVEKGEESDA